MSEEHPEAAERWLGLPPRPLPPPEAVAAVAAAVDLAWPRAPAAQPGEQEEPVHQRWRFSGRWWAKPTVMRRERPWA